jgi:hypothetical protein
MPSPQAVPCRLTALKILPSVTAAAVIHLSTALFTQVGIGTVRTWPPFPDEIHDDPVPLPNLDILLAQRRQLHSSEPASEENRDHCHVSSTPETFTISLLKEQMSLIAG